MSQGNYAREFFSRPENDDTIGNFKREYMESMKNLDQAMRQSPLKQSPLKANKSMGTVKNINTSPLKKVINNSNFANSTGNDYNNILNKNSNSDLEFGNNMANNKYNLNSDMNNSNNNGHLNDNPIRSKNFSSMNGTNNNNNPMRYERPRTNENASRFQINDLIDEITNLRQDLYRQQTTIQNLKYELLQEQLAKKDILQRVDQLERIHRSKRPVLSNMDDIGYMKPIRIRDDTYLDYYDSRNTRNNEFRTTSDNNRFNYFNENNSVDRIYSQPIQPVKNDSGDSNSNSNIINNDRIRRNIEDESTINLLQYLSKN